MVLGEHSHSASPSQHASSWAAWLCGYPAGCQAPAHALASPSITPVYEGWYENPDGTFSLSWGYFNRNSEELIEIPIGTDNRRREESDDGPPPLVTLTWHLYQGPGEATFADKELEIMEDGDRRAETTVTFTAVFNRPAWL